MLDRLEDKEVRRVSKKAKFGPTIDEDSGDEEDYDLPPADITKPSRTSRAELGERPRASDADSVTGDTEAVPVAVTKGRTLLITTGPASVGSALRKNADGSVAALKVLPKRNKGSKVKESHSI